MSAEDAADHRLDLARLHDKAHLAVEEGELIGMHGERHPLRLARLEADSREPEELGNRPRDVRDHIAEVELRDLLAVRASPYSSPRADTVKLPAISHRSGTERFEYSKLVYESPVPEREERGRGTVGVIALPVGLTARGLVGVVNRNLTDRAGERDGKAAGGVHVAEEDAGDSGGSLLAGEPCLDDGRAEFGLADEPRSGVR